MTATWQDAAMLIEAETEPASRVHYVPPDPHFVEKRVPPRAPQSKAVVGTVGPYRAAPIDRAELNRRFSAKLRALRERAGWSKNALALAIGIDPSYLTRIENGDRDAPTMSIVEAIAATLGLPSSERNELFVLAGYAPLSLLLLERWPPVMQAVLDVLGDDLLADEDRAEFEQVMLSVAKRWRGR